MKKIIVILLVLSLTVSMMPAACFAGSNGTGTSKSVSCCKKADKKSRVAHLRHGCKVLTSPALQDKLDYSLTLSDGRNILSDEITTDIDGVPVTGDALQTAAKLLMSLISAGKARDRYKNIMAMSEDIKKIYAQLNDIEKKIDDLTRQLEIDKYKSAIDKRHEAVIHLYEGCNPTFMTICNEMKDEVASDDWLDENYETLLGYLEPWAKSTCLGDTMTITVPSYLRLYTMKTADGKDYIDMFDSFAYSLYAWEHQGYDYREAERLTDMLMILEAYSLDELYYECLTRREQAEKEKPGKKPCRKTGKKPKDYSEFVKELRNSATAYMNKYNESVVNRRDNLRVSQIPGCKCIFEKSVDHLGIIDSSRAALKNSDFSLIADEKSEGGEKDRKLLDNARNNLKTYSDKAHTKDAVDNTGYAYVPKDVYLSINEYYKKLGERYPSEYKYEGLVKALSREDVGFTGFEDKTLFVTDDKTPHSWWGDMRVSEFEYHGYYIWCNRWKKNHDYVTIAGVDDKGVFKQNGYHMINSTNFKSGHRMDKDGKNADYDFVSLRLVK